MLFPYFLSHIFNRYILCLWNQKHSENSHDENPSREKQENSKLKVAQHGQESLSNKKSEQHVCKHGHTLSS